MKDEIKRRLTLLGVAPADILSGEIPVYAHGRRTGFMEADKDNIKEIESHGCKVYMVTRDMINGQLNLNYLTISSDPYEWKLEFYEMQQGDWSAQAFVTSPQTNGFFDVGNITLRHSDHGVYRAY